MKIAIIICITVNLVFEVYSVPLEGGDAATTPTITPNMITTASATKASESDKLSPVHIVTATSVPAPETSKNLTGTVVQKVDQNVADTAVENANAEPQQPQEEQEASASNADTAVYGPYLPEAIQHYVSQYGPAAAAAAAAAAYGPPYGAAAYPAPIGYAPVASVPVPPQGIYPSPYMVQSGYEGFLIPTTSSTTTTTTMATTTTPPNNNDNNGNNSTSLLSLLNPITLLTNLLPTLMMSTLFRVFASVISVIGMIFLGNSLTAFLCHFTPLCDMSYRAYSYLRQRGATQRLGRLLADEANQERVRRAAEFIQKAIHKYTELQKLIEE